MRRTREATAESRSRVLAEAGRLMRERGLAGVSVADVMAAAGMTHGGFYVHFPSKDALAAAAAEAAFDEPLGRLKEPDAHALARYVDLYLSSGHVAERGRGCPIAGLSTDAGRAHDDMCAAVAQGTRNVLAALADRLGHGDEAIRLLAVLLGGVMLARSVDDPLMAERIMTVLRQSSPVVDTLKSGCQKRPE
jgi:TetR/AcrR family transcriptional regulator, transcriptional repressor for nem operon